MTPIQYKRALKVLGATPASKKAASLLGITVRQSQRFANGENQITPTVCKLLKCLMEVQKRDEKSR